MNTYSALIVDDEIENIDLVIVDGPSTGTSAYARYPSFFSVQNKLASSYCIFLDDIKRNGTQYFKL